MSYPLTLKRVSSEARSHHREVSGHRHFSAFAPPPVFLSQKKKNRKERHKTPLSLSLSLSHHRFHASSAQKIGLRHDTEYVTVSEPSPYRTSSNDTTVHLNVCTLVRCRSSPPLLSSPLLPSLPSSPFFPFLSSLFPRTRIRNLRHIRNIRHVDQGSICSRSSSLLSPLSPALSLHLIDTCLLGGKHRGDDFF